MESHSASSSAVLDYIFVMSTELVFLIFFALGFCLLQSRAQRGGKLGYKAKKRKVVEVDVDYWKTIEIEANAGHAQGVLATWRSAQAFPAPSIALRQVTQAYLQVSKETMVVELASHIALHRSSAYHIRAVGCILDTLARCGEVTVMERFWQKSRSAVHIIPSMHMYDVMLGGYAAVGQEEKVLNLMGMMQAESTKVSARGFSLIIKGFLKNNMADAALSQMQVMKENGYFVPPFAVPQVFRVAHPAKRTEQFLSALEALEVPLPPEGAAVLLEDCSKQQNMALARRVEAWARRSEVPLASGAYDPMLKLCAVTGDLHGLELFEEMSRAGANLGEGLCVGLLTRCADAKFLAFAEQIVKYVRTKQCMNVALYSGLMKVYAFCGMYDRACALYQELLDDGLEPDDIMYGCLMKFSVECGRTDLARELFEKAPKLEIQNYMSLIRAAGRDGDVDRAFAILDKLQTSDLSSDLAAYNCVLDVCVSLGMLDRAHDLVASMRKVRTLDVITWNTLLKGHCTQADLQGAKSVLREMRLDGHVPNDISYNCLINAAVSSGNLSEAWDFVATMEKTGLKIDHYTVSIMMKALKKGKDVQAVRRALSLLDRSGLNVYNDEVLLNTVLETCQRHREMKRLQAIVEGLPSSGLQLSVHTYGSLIKACSTLKRLKQCRDLWSEMVSVRSLQPNEITLGCMLDALVCNGHVDEALALLNEWKEKVTTNAVMYSTVIKGFAGLRQPEQALDLWRELRSTGGMMNTVIYNTVIDAQARVGNMEAVSMLLGCMSEDGCFPDAITNSTVVKGYCIKGDLERALEVFRHMQAEGMVKDAIIYNTLLDGCARFGRLDLAEDMLLDMSAHGITPSDFTLGIMVKLYGKKGKVSEANRAVQEWPGKYNIVVNPQVWTALMCAYINDSNIEQALEAFNQLRQSGHSGDAKAYASLIHGCVRLGHLQVGVEVVDQAYGLRPHTKRGLPQDQDLDPENLDALLRAVSLREGKDAAAEVVKRLINAKVPLNGKIRAAYCS